MKTTLIQRILLLGGLGLSASFGAQAQQSNSNGGSNPALATVSCGTDTLRYPASKATGATTVSLIKGDIEGLAQWYERPASATLNGVSFMAKVKDGARTGKTATVTVKLYAAGADSLPQGIAMSINTVQIDTNMKVWKVPFLAGSTGATDFLISVEYGNGLFENDTIEMGLNAAGDGGGESLGAGLYNTTGGDIWLDFEHLIPNPDRDAMIFPWVSYSLSAGFDLPGDSVCVDEPLVFTNTSTALARSRMYNRRMQNSGGFGPAFSWSFGDGAVSTMADPGKVYTVTGSFSVLMTASITGYNTQCSEPATAAIVVEQRPLAMFMASAGTITQGDTVTFVNNSVGGTCAWDFGDGTAIVQDCADQSHVYDSAGTFTVVLTITSAYGCTDDFIRMVTVDALVGLDASNHQKSLLAFPNPTKDWVQIQLPNSGPAQLSLFDLQGHLLKSLEVANTTATQLSLADYPAGIYLLRVMQDGQQSHLRLIHSK